MAIQPIDEIDHRLPELGRIRAGSKKTINRKNGKGSFEGPSNSGGLFVLSGKRPDLLHTLAEIYGGKVEEWADTTTPDTHRLFTEANQLNIVLPPDPLSKPQYEMWEANTKRRECDGRIVKGWPKDGSPPVEVDCICQGVDDESKHCKPTTHLSVMLPELPVGVFRLTTRSKNAMAEMFRSAEVTRMASNVGLPAAHLTLDFRKFQDGKQGYVPVITTAASLAALASGAVSGGIALGDGGGTPVALPAPPRMALPAGAEVIDLDGEEVEL